MVSIENSIIRGLLYNEEYARKVYPFLDDSYFDGSHRTLFQLYKELFDKYNNAPNIEALAVSLQKKPIAEHEYEEIIEIVSEASKDLDDMPQTDWLIDETEEYCRDKAIYNAIYSSINIIEGTDEKHDKHAIPEMLDNALGVSFDSSIGMELFDDAERRYEMYTAEDNRIPFPLKSLNDLSNGGLKKKSLSAILAGPNVGKSALMCYLAGEFLKQGNDVLYISLEMGEELIYERVEANLLDVNTDDLKKLSKKQYLDGIGKIKGKTNGRFFAKEYPTSSAHAGHFRHLFKELRQKKKFKPQVVFIDYINICASSRYKSMNGVNSYSYIKAIAEEIRGLAVEFDVPIMTATQINRSGFSESAPGMDSTSESFGLPATLDWFVAMTTDEVMMENDRQLLHLLKTRWGNKAKLKPQMVGINWNKMRYYDVDGGIGSGPTTDEVKNKVGQNKPERKKLDEIDWD